MDAQFFVFRWGVKLCVYHLGMFTNSVPDKIETTGALPAKANTQFTIVGILLRRKIRNYKSSEFAQQISRK